MKYILLLLLFVSPAFSQVAWNVRQSGTVKPFSSVAFGNGVFVALAENPFTSPDGINWTARTWNASDDIHSVCFTGGRFIAFGNKPYDALAPEYRDGYLYVSSDGQTATRHNIAPWTTSFGNLQAESIGSETLLCGIYSPDGFSSPLLRITASNSVDRVPGFPSGDRVRWLVRREDEVIACTGEALFASTDGISWTLRSREPVERPAVKSGALYSYNRMSSDGGATWITLDSINEPYGFQPRTFAGGSFVALGNSLVYTSETGVNWSQRETGTTDFLTGIAFGNNTFVAVGYNGRVTTSSAVSPSPAVVAPALAVVPSITLKWHSTQGLWYQVQSSPDMQTWTDTPDLIGGSGAQLVRSFEISSARRYYRVLVK